MKPFLLVLVLVALAVAFLLWDPTTAATETAPAPSPALPGPALADGAGLPSAALPPEESRSRVAPPAALPERAPEPWASPEQGVRVRVLRAEDQSPCAGASVSLLVEGRLETERFDADCVALGRPDEAWTRHSRLYLADEDGLAVVPAAAGALRLRAEHEGRVAQTVLRDAHGGMELTLELAPNLDLQVQVVNAAGEPVAEIPVALRAGRGRWDNTLEVALSDDRGLAVFRHASSHFHSNERPFERASVELNIPLEEAVQSSFDPLALPEEPLRLVMPATGSVLVHLVDELDLPLLTPLPVTLMLDSNPEAELSRDWNRDNPLRNRSGTTRFAEDGRASFPHVGLGLELSAFAAVGGSQYLDQAKARGPRQSGEVAELTIRPNPLSRVIAGRLVQPDGKPPPPARMKGIYLADRVTFMSWNREGPRTDELGRFRLAVSDWFALPARLVLLHPGEDPEEPPLQALLQIPDDLPRGVTDVGDLALEAAPVLVAGRIRFTDGTPVVGAALNISHEVEEAGFGRWARLWELRDRTDATGSFRIFGSLPGVEQARLGINSDRAQYTRRDFRPGEQGLEILLEPCGGLAGSVLLDPAFPAELLDLSWQVERDGRRTGGMLSLDAGGHFEQEGLAAGPGHFSIGWKRTFGGMAPDKNVVYSVDLDLPPGAVHRDPRLQEIDLRSLRVYRIRVQPPEGSKLSSTFARPLESNRPFLRAVDGVITIPSWFEIEDWRLESEGFLAEDLRGVRGDRTVELKPAIAVALEIEGPELPAGFQLVVRASGSGVTAMGLGSRTSLSGGAGTLYFQEAGEYQLHFQLHQQSQLTQPYSFPPEADIQPTTLTVLDLREGQRCRIRISESALREAVSKLGSDPGR